MPIDLSDGSEWLHGNYKKLAPLCRRVGDLTDVQRAIGFLGCWEEFVQMWSLGAGPSRPVCILFLHNGTGDLDLIRRDLKLGDLFHSERGCTTYPGIMPTVFVFDTQYFLEWIGNPHDWETKLHEMAYWVEFVFQTKDQHLAANDAFTTLILGIGMALMGEDMLNEPGEDADERFEDLATLKAWNLPRGYVNGVAPSQKKGASLIEKTELMNYPYKRDTYLISLDLEHNDHFGFPFECRQEVGCDGRPMQEM